GFTEHLNQLKKRYDDEVRGKLGLEIQLKKAEMQVKNLQEEVNQLRGRVQEFEAREVENGDKEEKLREAFVEIARLREHSVTVGHYLIDSAVKNEAKKEELL
ncbi:hypothetical protein H0H93_001065, partial [Arthromyces matolae]